MKYSVVILMLLYAFSSIQCTTNKLPDQYCQIVSKPYSKSINIPRASEYEGERLILWDKKHCRFNQEWKLEPINGYFIIRSKYNNLVIGSNDRIVQQNKYAGNNNQLWEIQPTKDGYLIISKENQLVLTATNSQHDNIELKLSERTNDDSQIWYFEPSGMEYEKTNFNRILTAEEMTADIEYFFSKLNEVHVNPYAFVSKDSVTLRKNELLKQVSKPMPVYKFCQIISGINGLFDGHTGISEIDWDYINNYNNHYGRYFPYVIKYGENAIYVQSDVDSLMHKKIIAINGISVPKIRSEIEKRISLESRTMRNLRIEKNFAFYLMGIFDIKPPFDISLVDTLNNTEKSFRTAGVIAFQLPQKVQLNTKPYSFREFPNESIAIIEYNTCGINNLKEFDNYIDSVFRVIKQNGIQDLFIDISRNGGGSTSTNDIFYKNINHLPNSWVETYTKKISQESKLHTMGLSLYNSSDSFEKRMAEYKKRIESDNLSSWQKEITSIENGGFFHKDLRFCTDKVTNGYANNLYIIQSVHTYSAAVDMSAWFKYSKVGKLIGTETGGMSTVYIEGIPFVLPNSKLNFRVSDNYSSYPNGSLEKGIMPDVYLPQDFYKEKYSLNDLKQFIQKAKH